ncbi:MAG: hypothetical protein ACPG4T_12840, partial [Nannocystaceae bacterium]
MDATNIRRFVRLLTALVLCACEPSGGLAIEPGGVSMPTEVSESYGSSSGFGSGGSVGLPPPQPGSTTDDGSSGETGEGSLLVAAQSLWRYTTQTPPPEWTEPTFDDLSWVEGAAPLGSGVADVVTQLDANAPSVWLRHVFTISSAGSEQLVVHLRRADGAAVYLNGALLVASNLSGGAGDFSAEDAAGGDEGKRYFRFAAPGSSLVEGENV